MIKHFILNLNPQAQFDWERCVLHHPITAEQPDLAKLLASDLDLSNLGLSEGNAPTGSYLISVKIEVAILESTQPEAASAIAAVLPRSLDRVDHLRSLAEVA